MQVPMFRRNRIRPPSHGASAKLLSIIICLGFVIGSITCQIVGIHLGNGHNTNGGESVVVKESIIARKQRVKNICDITEYNENIECEYLEDSMKIAFIFIDCKELREEDSVISLLSDCKSNNKLQKNNISYKECTKAYCDSQEGVMSLLVIQAVNENEINNAYKLSSTNFRLRESTRVVKLAPIALHLLLRKRLFSFSDPEKTTFDWETPFFNKYITYFIGSTEFVPTLSWVLEMFEHNLFSYSNNTSEEQPGINKRVAFNTSKSLIDISWVLITKMEMYWSRGVSSLVTGNSTNGVNSTDPFNHGLSNRIYCSLGPHSFLLDFKPYIDSIEYALEREDASRNVTNLGSEGISLLFDELEPDIDSFYILPSPYEITSEGFDAGKYGGKELLDIPFPCMSQYKDRMKRPTLQSNLFKKFQNSKETGNTISNNVTRDKSEVFSSKRTIYEDVYSLVNIVDSLMSYILRIFETEGLLESSTTIKYYYDIFKGLIDGVKDIKNEVNSICSPVAYKKYKSLRNKSTYKKQNCTLRYSIEVVNKLNSLFAEKLKYLIEKKHYRRYYLYSTEQHIRSTYCIYKGIYDSGHSDLPNEILGRVAIPFSMIHEEKSSFNDTSTYKNCSDHLMNIKGDIVNPTHVPSICKSFSDCMQNKSHLIDSIEIYKKLKNIDLVGDFDKKVALTRDFCIYSRSLFPLSTDNNGRDDIIDCRLYRLFQLVHRSSMLIGDVKTVKFKIDLFSKEGYFYFVQDGSTASYILINDFCTDPDVTELIQCNIDLSESNSPFDKRRYNFIKLPDGSRILTPLYFKDPSDPNFLSLANGVLFSKILKNNNADLNSKLSYFSGIPFPYSLGNPDLSRKECEHGSSKYSYFPEISNPQMVLVMKMNYFTSPVAYIKSDFFNPTTLIRNSRIFKEKFSVPEFTGFYIPLVPSIVQIENTKYFGSACSHVLYPYLMLTEFVNPHIDYSSGDSQSNISHNYSSLKNKDENKHTLNDIRYPTGLSTVTGKISDGEPLALNFIATGRGYRFLYKALKAYYMIGYLFFTTVISFWTGGTKYRQHCDLHGENAILRIPSEWMKYKWEPFLDNIIEHINLNYFSIIDLDYSYESDMNVSNVLRDLMYFPDKNPCKHPSVTEGNQQYSENDYQRIIEYICPQISLKDLFDTIFYIYPSKEHKKETFANYMDIIRISDFTYDYCNEIKKEIDDLVERDELTFLKGYNYFRDLRRAVWNSLLQLNELEPNIENQKSNFNSVSKSNDTSSEDIIDENCDKGKINLNITKEVLFYSPPLYNNSSSVSTGAVSLRNFKAVSEGNNKLVGSSEVNFHRRLVPDALPSMYKHALYLYCTSKSTKRIIDRNYDFKSILNFLLQRSSLEGYLRHIHFGSSFDDFGVGRSILDSVEIEYRNCVNDKMNSDLLKNKLMKLIIENPNSICPKNICTDIRHLDLFESLVVVYRYHFDHLILTIHDSGYHVPAEERTVDIKVFMVERNLDAKRKDNLSNRILLNLNIDHIRSIIEMNNFCARDRHYSSLEFSGQENIYTGIMCKENPEFKEYGIHANGLIIIQITYLGTATHESMVFPWIYNSKFSVFEPMFNYKETTHGISVIGQLVQRGEKNENNALVFIHKGGKSIYDFNSHMEKYSVPPSIISRLEVKQETLFRNYFIGENRIKSRIFDVFYLDNNVASKDHYNVSLFDWLNGSLKELNNSKFNDIPRDTQKYIIYYITKVASVFKSIWVPIPECKYSGTKFPCFPMFCGISNKNIILEINKSNNSINDVKFLFANDMVIVDSFDSESISELEEDDNSSEKNKVSNLNSKLRNKILEVACGPNESNANDLITVASTLRTLLSSIEENLNFDIENVFSSEIENIYYNYSEMDILGLFHVIDNICTELSKLYYFETRGSKMNSALQLLC